MSDTIIVERQIKNEAGEIVGGWKRMSNGDELGWYCPYIPLNFRPVVISEDVMGFDIEAEIKAALAYPGEPKPEIDWLAINREFS